MRLSLLGLSNFGPYKQLPPVPLGVVHTLVGQNDSGKSSVLRALVVFLGKGGVESEWCHTPADDSPVSIELSFEAPPATIQLEDGIDTTLHDERLLDESGRLTIKKTYSRSNPRKFDLSVRTFDFADARFSALTDLAEAELVARGTSVGLSLTRSGAGTTNRDRRQLIRAKAVELAVPLVSSDQTLALAGRTSSALLGLLPKVIYFASETDLDTDSATFQSPFKLIVQAAVRQPTVAKERHTVEEAIQAAVQAEMDQLYTELTNYTDEFARLGARTTLSWDKAVNVQVWGTDSQGIEQSLDRRGSGFRRLLMVAFFRYLALRGGASLPGSIFAVEEPENSLHPGLQRDLASSFRRLTDGGDQQVVITTHSPVFAGAAERAELSLVSRSEGLSTIGTGEELDLGDVARSLGISPADQLVGAKAALFVEGPSDAEFLTTLAHVWAASGDLAAPLEDRGIVVVPCGGESIRYFVDKGVLGRLNAKFVVLVDSDRRSAQAPVPQRKLNWKQRCEADGGTFFITRKRELENYLHPDAIQRFRGSVAPFDDFTDMKELFNERVWNASKRMTAAEFLQMDRYTEGGADHHELLEVLRAVHSLVV